MQSYLYILFFLSGVAGLGYEIIWTRMLTVVLGHEIVSTLAVVSAFFSGLALGAWFLDRRVSSSPRPGQWYALLELIIGIWALILVVALPYANPIAARVIGEAPSAFRHWGVAFIYPFLVLLPATMAMGGTLPAMDRLVDTCRRTTCSVGGLYGINTLGAMAGTLLTTFIILPTLGLRVSSISLAMLNFLGAAGVYAFSSQNAAVRPNREDGPNNSRHHTVQIYAVLVLTGLAGIGFEVLMVRVFSQTMENTVYSFAAMLVVFLFGTAAGAGLYQKFRSKASFETPLALLLIATALCSLLSILLLRFVPQIFEVFQSIYGRGGGNAVSAGLTTALLYFLLPTMAMGATFSHLAQSVKQDNGGVGRALCLNTVGSAVAPLVFGVLILQAAGLTYALFAIPCLYLLCLVISGTGRRYALAGTGLLAAIAVTAAVSTPYRFVTLQAGETLPHHSEGVMASVSVVRDAGDRLHLKINNHYQMGGTASVFSDRRQGLLPLLLHKAPRTALFLGLGSGATFASAAGFPDLQAVGVELIPEVIDALPYFSKATGDLSKARNLRMVSADARRFVAATEQKFDVIVADLFHPARDGAGALYTIEHFRAIRDRLNENGLFCQWLPLYQLDLEMFKVISRTFLEVFPHGQAWLAHYSIDQPIIGLIGAKAPLRFPERWYRKRMPDRNARRHLAGFGYDGIYSLLGTFMADAERMRQFAGDAPVNSDDHPIVLFRAPEFLYGSPEPPQNRLMTMIDAFSPPDPESILAKVITEEDLMARSRLSAYWRARDSFLELGAKVQRTRDVVRLYEETSAPLLDIVRKSIDFSAAYYPLISIAYELYPHDRDAAFRLLRSLERANPMRREAGALRHKLFSER